MDFYLYINRSLVLKLWFNNFYFSVLKVLSITEHEICHHLFRPTIPFEIKKESKYCVKKGLLPCQSTFAIYIYCRVPGSSWQSPAVSGISCQFPAVPAKFQLCNNQRLESALRQLGSALTQLGSALSQLGSAGTAGSLPIPHFTKITFYVLYIFQVT